MMTSCLCKHVHSQAKGWPLMSTASMALAHTRTDVRPVTPVARRLDAVLTHIGGFRHARRICLPSNTGEPFTYYYSKVKLCSRVPTRKVLEYPGTWYSSTSVKSQATIPRIVPT